MTIVAAVYFYLCVLLFAGGLVYRWTRWMSAPAPMNLSASSVKVTRFGAAVRVAGELFLFRSLLRGGGRMLWFLAMGFHYSLLFVALRHARFFLEPVPSIFKTEIIQDGGLIAGAVFAVSTFLFICRRYTNVYLAISSVLSDYIALLLLLATGASGWALSYYFRQDLVEAKNFIQCLMALRPAHESIVAPGVAFIVHFFIACSLFAYFPFSKLLHAGAVAFAPTRYHATDALSGRRRAPDFWDSEPDNMNNEWSDLESAGVDYSYNMKDIQK